MVYDTPAKPYNGTDADFRAWINVIHDALIAGGWLQTADTGQIDFGAVAAPGAANTKQGYAVYETDDAMTTVILKLAFGSGQAGGGGALVPALWFAVGLATDGAGNFINPDDDNRAAPALLDQYSQTVGSVASASSTNALRECFGSAGPGWASLLMFESKGPINRIEFVQEECTEEGFPCGACRWSNSAFGWGNHVADHVGEPANYVFMFVIERARDDAGAERDDAVLVKWSAVNARLNRQAFVPLTYGLAPIAVAAGFSHQLHPQSIPLTNDVYSTGQGCGTTGDADYPVTGLVAYERNTMPRLPGVGEVVSRFSFFSYLWPGDIDPLWCECKATNIYTAPYITGNVLTNVNIYGSAHSYRASAGMRPNTVADAVDSHTYILIRYD